MHFDCVRHVLRCLSGFAPPSIGQFVDSNNSSEPNCISTCTIEVYSRRPGIFGGSE